MSNVATTIRPRGRSRGRSNYLSPRRRPTGSDGAGRRRRPPRARTTRWSSTHLPVVAGLTLAQADQVVRREQVGQVRDQLVRGGAEPVVDDLSLSLVHAQVDGCASVSTVGIDVRGDERPELVILSERDHAARCGICHRRYPPRLTVWTPSGSARWQGLSSPRVSSGRPLYTPLNALPLIPSQMLSRTSRLVIGLALGSKTPCLTRLATASVCPRADAASCNASTKARAAAEAALVALPPVSFASSEKPGT